MKSQQQKAAGSSRMMMGEMIRAAYEQKVNDGHGKTMPEVYLHENWELDEGFTVNAITSEGLTFRQTGADGATLKSTVFPWSHFKEEVLKEVLRIVDEEDYN